eukprot:TRINITY_DN8964_c0_g1_i1.p1 TRINITY_DN8964_c0_g1~~TRINITY_DN8964_c0_g1_i1.p1  ORF type:complete len:124 (+),score=11.79 TRINITY_DN8964_c0_g1_i1:73-444(+)
MVKTHKKPNIRLFQPGVMLGFRRSHHKQREHTSLLAIKGVATRNETDFYVGKRCLYVYKAPKKKVTGPNGKKHPELLSKTRRIWGRVTRPHGKNGVVRAKFQRNLPGHAIGRKIRVYLFPSRI